MQKHLPMSIGQAGVYRVLSELLLRGFVPLLPVVDTGVDIYLEGGIRLQVKTTLRPTMHWRYTAGSYLFQLAPGRRLGKGNEIVQRVHRKMSSFCDFVILFAADSGRFWIVPSPVLDGRATLQLSPSHQWVEFDLDAAKRMKAEGMSIAKIAVTLGVGERTLHRRLDGSFSIPKRNYTSFKVKDCEGRWDLITSYLSTLRDADVAIEGAKVGDEGSPSEKEQK